MKKSLLRQMDVRNPFLSWLRNYWHFSFLTFHIHLYLPQTSPFKLCPPSFTPVTVLSDFQGQGAKSAISCLLHGWMLIVSFSSLFSFSQRSYFNNNPTLDCVEKMPRIVFFMKKLKGGWGTYLLFLCEGFILLEDAFLSLMRFCPFP